ncbi:MAG: hypothetical protein JO326_14985 [Acetobacteraceae bacterium]|nr:hypothetical protein [Acetobacteraceae bacterium]
MRWTALALLPVLVGGCTSLVREGTSDVAGIAGAGAASAVTKSATVGAAVGLGVKSLADLGLDYAERRVHGAEQDMIASVAGPLPLGTVQTWAVSHDIPLEGDEHGRVVVSRDIGGPGLPCREIVFSVDRDQTATARGFFTATICQDGARWRWATAEPATARWDGLQQ